MVAYDRRRLVVPLLRALLQFLGFNQGQMRERMSFILFSTGDTAMAVGYPSSLLPLRMPFPSYLTMTDRSAHVVIMRHVSEIDNPDDRHSKFSHENRTQYILGGIGGIGQTRSRHVPPQTRHNGGGHDGRHLLLIYIRCALCNKSSPCLKRALRPDFGLRRYPALGACHQVWGKINNIGL